MIWWKIRSCFVERGSANTGCWCVIFSKAEWELWTWGVFGKQYPFVRRALITRLTSEQTSWSHRMLRKQIAMVIFCFPQNKQSQLCPAKSSCPGLDRDLSKGVSRGGSNTLSPNIWSNKELPAVCLLESALLTLKMKRGQEEQAAKCPHSQDSPPYV